MKPKTLTQTLMDKGLPASYAQKKAAGLAARGQQARGPQAKSAMATSPSSPPKAT